MSPADRLKFVGELFGGVALALLFIGALFLLAARVTERGEDDHPWVFLGIVLGPTMLAIAVVTYFVAGTA